MSTKTKRLSQKADLVAYFCQPELEKLDIFAQLELEKIKFKNSNKIDRVRESATASPQFKLPKSAKKN